MTATKPAPKYKDVREDGYIFVCMYSKKGKRYERWLSPQSFEIHIAKVRKSNSIWRERSNEIQKEYRKRRSADNPELTMCAGAKRRAKQRGLPFDITLDDVVIPEKCPALGIPLFHNIGGNGQPTDNSPELDRIIPSKGYVKGNIIVVSRRANRVKSNISIEDLVAIADFYRGYL